MTDEERRQWNGRKEALIGRSPAILESLGRRRGLIDAADERIYTYCRDVLAHPEEHNLYECLGVERFVGMLGRHRFNPERVRRFFRLYECLKFNGPRGRQRYRLTPVQTFQFGNIYGFEEEDGRRLIRTAYIFVPRKFSKTTSAAALAVDDLLFGDVNAQAYVGANSYNQAKICFDEIRAILRGIDPQERHLRINREKCHFKGGERDSLVACLSANAKTMDGLNASLVIMDEYSQARNTPGKNGSDLKNVLTSSMGARREPLTVVITTASEVTDGPFAHELEGVKRILEGEVENDSVFASLFMPDADDREDDPATWRKVQPHLGVTVQEDYYRRAWEDAQLSAENMLTFRTKLLNIFTVNERALWIKPDEIRNVYREIDPGALPERPEATVAVDLSVRGDFSAVTLGIYLKREKAFHYITDYFLPEESVPGHPSERLLRRWVEDGWLHLTPGSALDYRVIVNHILGVGKKVRLLAIGYDPYRSLDCVNMLRSAGLGKVLKPIRQNIMSFTAACQSFEAALLGGKITMNPNPINAYCFGNAVLMRDSSDNMKPEKRSPTGRIDGVITVLMSLKCFAEAKRRPL